MSGDEAGAEGMRPGSASAGGAPGHQSGDDKNAGQDTSAAQGDDETRDGNSAEEDGRPDQPQDAWSARRDLWDHSPRTMRVGADGQFGSSHIGGEHHGVSGGLIVGDVITGGKTEITYQLGFSTALHTSGEVPQSVLDRLVPFFVADDVFDGLVSQLLDERVLVLSGPHFSGRRTAALMLLHRLGLSPVHTLVRDTPPTELARLGADAQQARGYLLCDLVTRRDQPLREAHLLAARDQLAKDNAYLVITLGPTAALDGVCVHVWNPPSAAQVLAAHLRVLTSAEQVPELLSLPAVADFLAHHHQLREVAVFAGVLRQYADGDVDEQAVERFSLAAIDEQVREWFEEDDGSVHLRDKAFLVALAAFDGGPYALTAELSDLLYAFLLKTENPSLPPKVPVFGTHIGKRLQLARAKRYDEPENTEWGPVAQSKAAFLDERVALVLLRELWTGHPSARPALVAWLRRLAEDGRPLVRTRAASTVAVLAFTDLPSAMALVIEPWAVSSKYRGRLVAVNALVLAHFLGTPNVPRILDDWCDSEDPGLCWVAIRAYALIGPERPQQTLAALRRAARNLHAQTTGEEGVDELLASELGASVGLLLLSPARDVVIAELRRTLDDDRAVHDLALGGFVGACRHTENDERYGSPLVLDWYAKAPTGAPSAENIAFLWRAALGDRNVTRSALDLLRAWVLIADRSSTTEWALAALLPALVTTVPEHQRLTHLLRTMPGEDGAPPPPAAARLLTVLPNVR